MTLDGSAFTPWPALLGGLLIGARYGAGCTSGHGVCGLSRFSLRSIVATLLAIVASGAGEPKALEFRVAMLAGMLLFELAERSHARAKAPFATTTASE